MTVLQMHICLWTSSQRKKIRVRSIRKQHTLARLAQENFHAKNSATRNYKMAIRSAGCARRLNAERMSRRTVKKTTRGVGSDGGRGEISTTMITKMFLNVEMTTVIIGVVTAMGSNW